MIVLPEIKIFNNVAWLLVNEQKEPIFQPDDKKSCWMNIIIVIFSSNNLFIIIIIFLKLVEKWRT